MQCGLAEEARGAPDSAAARSRALGGVVEAVLGLGDGAEHGLGVHQAPRVADRGRGAATASVASRVGAGGVAEHERAVGAEQQAGRRLPGAGPARRYVAEAGRGQLASTSCGRPCWMRRNARCRSTSARRTVVGRARRRAARARVEVGLRRGSTSPADASSQPASSSAVARVARRAWSRGGERVADPGGAGDAVAEHHPGPAEPVGDADAEQRVVRGAPGQRGVDVGPLGPGDRQAVRLAGAADVRVAPVGRPRRTRRRARPSATSAEPGLAQPVARRRPGCCRAAGSAPPRRRRSSTLTSDRSTRRPIDVDRPPRRGRRARRARARPRPAARRRRSTTAPTGRAGRRGTAGRSSRRSPPASARRRSGRRLVGSLQQGEAVVEPSGDLAGPTATAPGRRRARWPAAARRGTRQTSSTIAAVVVVEHELARASRGARRRTASPTSAGVSGSSVVHDLAVEAERHLAGREHPQARRARRAAGATRSATASTTCSQLSSSEHRLGARRAGRRSVARRRRRAASRPRPAASDGGGVGRVEPDQPDAARRRRAARPTSMRQPGLADAGRPDDRHQPVLAEQRRRRRRGRRRGRPAAGASGGQVADGRVGAAAGGRRRRARGSAAGPAARAPRSAGPGSTPSSSTSSRAHPGVRRQRVGLPAGPVERGDQRGPEALAQRVLRRPAPRARRSPRRRRRGRPGRPAGPRAGRAGPPRAGPGGRASQSPSPASTRTSPRNSASASPAALQRRRRVARAARAADAAAARSATRRASTLPAVDVQGVAAARRRRPGSGSPRARRSWDTFDCRVLRPCRRRRPTGPRSARRRGPRRPASSASRTSSSVVLPAGSREPHAVAVDLDRAEHGRR